MRTASRCPSSALNLDRHTEALPGRFGRGASKGGGRAVHPSRPAQSARSRVDPRSGARAPQDDGGERSQSRLVCYGSVANSTPTHTERETHMTASILWPMLAHIGWVFMIYAWLTVARQRAVKRGQIDYSCFVLGREEPLAVARITRNFANQFELPVIFYALV